MHPTFKHVPPKFALPSVSVNSSNETTLAREERSISMVDGFDTV